MYEKLLKFKTITLKSRFNESQFNEIPRFSEQMPAPLNYFTIVDLFNLVNYMV